jgi:hypothetical protein
VELRGHLSNPDLLGGVADLLDAREALERDDNSHRRVGFDEAPPQPDRHRDDADSPSDVCPPQDFDAGA